MSTISSPKPSLPRNDDDVLSYKPFASSSPAATATTTATTGTKRKAVTPPPANLTEVPSNLSALSNDELQSLVRKIADERTDLSRELKRARTETVSLKPTPIAKANVPAPAAVAVAAVATVYDVKATKKRINKQATAQIKKTAHSKPKKPYTTISDMVPDTSSAMALFAPFVPISDTSRMIKWKLTDCHEITSWLENEKGNGYIHPVKFEGKVYCFGNSKPKIYAWAQFDSLEAKYEKKSGALTLKFRTFLAATGKTHDGLPAYLY